MKRAIFFVLPLLFLHLLAKPAFAFTVPPVFSCQAPVGNTIADFNDGAHGIAGDSATYTGSDHVFSVDSDHVLQCFCPTGSNEGIASNWMKLSDTSEESIHYYETLGWVYIPNGQAWGLDDSAYVVKNDHFACFGEEGGAGSTDGGSNTSSNSDSSSNNSSSSNSNGGGDAGAGTGGQILGQILGDSTLADTGNDRVILLYLALGISFALIAYRLAQE